MKSKDYAVAVQYGASFIHFSGFYDSMQEANMQAGAKANMLKKEKKKKGPSPSVTVWRKEQTYD